MNGRLVGKKWEYSVPVIYSDCGFVNVHIEYTSKYTKNADNDTYRSAQHVQIGKQSRYTAHGHFAVRI